MHVTFRFMERMLRIAPSILISTILHTMVLIVLALWFVAQQDQRQPMTVVVAQEDGVSEADLITDSVQLDTEPVAEEPIDLALTSEQMPLSEFGELAAVSLLDGVDGLTGHGFDEGLEGDFGDKIHYARLHGLDVVLVFDSTGSMSAEIDEVKARVQAIGNALLQKIPSSRISLVTYRDHLRRPGRRGPINGIPKHYVVRGIRLTHDVSDFDQFLIGIAAGAGGDRPEAVLDGLEWAIQRNEFSAKSLKVILIFGDAPPHKRDMKRCLALAENFHKRQKGTISTITCRRPHPLDEFYRIARAGGGEAHTLQNSRWLLNELLVLTFGSGHRESVLEFFDLD